MSIPKHGDPKVGRALVGLAVGALALIGCAAPTVLPYSHRTPVVLTTANGAGVRDLRGVYRTALCRRLPAAEPPCDQVLLELAGEISSPPSDPQPGAAQRYRVVFVDGLLAECLEGIRSVRGPAFPGLTGKARGARLLHAQAPRREDPHLQGRHGGRAQAGHGALRRPQGVDGIARRP